MQNIDRVDGLTRSVGGSLLLIGSLLALPGIDARTVETVCLWTALFCGCVAIGASLRGYCAWYAGIFITGSSLILLSIRSLPHPTVTILASSVGIAVAALAMFTHVAGHCPVNAAVFRPRPVR